MEIIELPGADTASDTGDISPRPYLAHHLPDGTPLHLTAGILNNLAAIYSDEFSTWVPSRADEFATLLWMASRPRKDRGAAWLEGVRALPSETRKDSPALISDFPALRATVTRWLDDAFRASESGYVIRLGVDLWKLHNAARVAVTEKKTEDQAAT